MTLRVCGRHAYSQNGDLDGNCLARFPPSKWQNVILQFEKLKNNLLRNDASFIVLPSKVNEGIVDCSETDQQIPNSDDSLNEELASQQLFTSDYINMADWIKFHSCLAHLWAHPNDNVTIERNQEGEITCNTDNFVHVPHATVLNFQCVIGIWLAF